MKEFDFFHTFFLLQELKKDPGIPRLPNLKVKVRNAQTKPMVCFHVVSSVLTIFTFN